MAIKTSIANNIRKPESFAEFDVTGGARGLANLTRTIGLVGMRKAAGTKAQATLSQVFTDADADLFFGKGSELALMCRAAIQAGKIFGSLPQIWAVPMDEPAGGAVKTTTLTVTGPATAAGDVVFKVAGRVLRAAVASGDTATVVAAAIRDAINAKPELLPCSATAAVGVTTVSYSHKGVNGNDLKISVVSAPTGIAIVVAAGVAGAGVYNAATALNVLYDKRYYAVALSNHLAQDITDLKAYVDARNAAGVKAWAWGGIAETGTLATATTLAGGGNYKDVAVVSAENFPWLPGEIIANIAACVESQTDAAYNFDGTELSCALPEPTDLPTNAEIETALAAGTTILGANSSQDRSTIIRLVSTKTTEAGVAFENLLDLSNTRALFEVAAQVDAKLKLVLQNGKKNARTKNRVKAVALDVLRKLEEIEVVQNVEAHLGELQVEDDATVSTRLNVSIPTSVVPNLHQLAAVYTLFVE